MDGVLESSLHGLSAASLLLNQLDRPLPVVVDSDNHNHNHNRNPRQAFDRERQIMARSAIDVTESPTSYTFQADMPGLKSSDVQVQIEGNILSIKGKRKMQEEEKIRYIISERRPFDYHRKLLLPVDADIDSVKATCEDGILTVTVQRIPPPQPKIVTIPVN